MVSRDSKVIGSKRALRETRREWSEKLRQIDVSELKQVRTFAEGGHGRVSLVHLAEHPDRAFALKIVKKSELDCREARWNALWEKNALIKAQSDFVIKLYKTFVDEKHVYLLTEYCPGGNLSSTRPRSEYAAKFYTACAVEALACLRSQDIVHSDVKPANLVLDDEGYARLIDMGMARQIEKGKLSYTSGGTTNYMPPEIGCWELGDRSRYCRDRGVDLWSLGVTIYKLLSGALPFRSEDGDQKKTCLNIDRGIDSVRFSESHFSADAIDLIKKLCAHDRKDRLGYDSIQEIRNHRWFENFDWTALRNRELKPPMIPKVKDALDTRNFRAPQQKSSALSSSDANARSDNDFNWGPFDALFINQTPFNMKNSDEEIENSKL